MFAAGETINQSTAQINTANLNNRGSDDSMESATNNAMKAVMDIASLNIPGAFYHGYKGYSEYTNSERLDDLEAKNKYLRNKMLSSGPGGVEATTKQTTFSRLNHDFLYKGEVNETATEFEKKSGMSREEFMRHLSSATDSDLSWDDPNLLQKLEQRFDVFTSAIPNKDFRDGLKQAANMIPTSQRTEILGKLFSNYKESWSGSGKTEVAQNSGSDISTPVANNAVNTASESKPAVRSAGESNLNRDPAANIQAFAKIPAYQKSEFGIFLGVESNPKDAINDYLGAVENRDDLSIFQIVTKKYRALTPKLSNSKSAL